MIVIEADSIEDQYNNSLIENERSRIDPRRRREAKKKGQQESTDSPMILLIAVPLWIEDGRYQTCT
jgi:hypothetical protein